jgi:hypothetical protein
VKKITNVLKLMFFEKSKKKGKGGERRFQTGRNNSMGPIYANLLGRTMINI